MIRERKDRDGLQVQVYAGRDALTGRKRYVSRQVPGSGRTAMRQARQVEAQLLAEVAAGKHQGSAMTLAQLLDEWLGWRESNGKPISPATLHNYRLTIETKIKPGLGPRAGGPVGRPGVATSSSYVSCTSSSWLRGPSSCTSCPAS